MPEINARPPRDNLVRALQRPLELREDGDGMPTLVSEFARFNEWTEIDSWFEGRFMERISRGAFKKTMAENRSEIKPLFQHGQDPQVGSKPLGTVTSLRETGDAAVGEVELLDTVYNRELMPGLKAGLYGSSFRFQVMREDIKQKPEHSDANPDGLPERTIKEVRLYEFGPVTFPAYSGTSAGLRSLTLPELRAGFVFDEEALEQFTKRPSGIVVPRDITPMLDGEEIVVPFMGSSTTTSGTSGITPSITTTLYLDKQEIAKHVSVRSEDEDEPESQEAPPDSGDAPADDAPPDEAPVEDAPLPVAEAAASVTSETRDDKEKTMADVVYRNDAEVFERQAEIASRLTEIDAEYGVNPLPEDVNREFKALGDEKRELKKMLEDWADRKSTLADLDEEKQEKERPARIKQSSTPDDLFSLDEYRLRARTTDEHRQLLRDGAMKIVDTAYLPSERVDEDKAKSHIERLLHGGIGCDGAVVAQRIIATSSPLYERAFWKAITQRPMNSEEQRAMGLTDNAGGYAVPAFLDPTVVPTSDGVMNPVRGISRVESITGDTWKGVTSDGVTATRTTEATAASDAAPAFAGPEITPTRVHCWIPFSYEIGMDFQGLQAELARMLSDAKDAEEADQFVNGNGDPEGVVAGLALTSHIVSGTVNGFEGPDIYRTKDALPPRFQPRAQWMANTSFYSEIRQLDTTGGGLFWANLNPGLPPSLIGKPTNEASEMSATSVSGDDVLLYGDFSYYCIVDRIGMSIELVPHVLNSSMQPTGQRGVYAFWRNSAEILSDNAFRLLTIGLTS